MEIDKLHGKKYLILIDREIGFYSNDQKTRIFFKIWCSIFARTWMCLIIWCSSLLELECARSSDARARSIPELFDARPPLMLIYKKQISPKSDFARNGNLKNKFYFKNYVGRCSILARNSNLGARYPLILDAQVLVLARYPNFMKNHMLVLARYPNFLMLAHPYRQYMYIILKIFYIYLKLFD